MFGGRQSGVTALHRQRAKFLAQILGGECMHVLLAKELARDFVYNGEGLEGEMLLEVVNELLSIIERLESAKNTEQQVQADPTDSLT